MTQEQIDAPIVIVCIMIITTMLFAAKELGQESRGEPSCWRFVVGVGFGASAFFALLTLLLFGWLPPVGFRFTEMIVLGVSSMLITFFTIITSFKSSQKQEKP